MKRFLAIAAIILLAASFSQATIFLRYATASQEVSIGQFVDSTDGVTAETGLTIANTDILIHKAGGATLLHKTSGGATHMAGGVYYAVLDANDTSVMGPLVLYVQVAGACPERVECDVLDPNVYDTWHTSAGTKDPNGLIKVALHDISAAASVGTSTDVSTAVQTGLTAQGLTSVRAALLDYLDSILSNITITDGKVETDATGVLVNATYGLSALKALIDTKPAIEDVNTAAGTWALTGSAELSAEQTAMLRRAANKR